MNLSDAIDKYAPDVPEGENPLALALGVVMPKVMWALNEQPASLDERIAALERALFSHVEWVVNMFIQYGDEIWKWDDDTKQSSFEAMMGTWDLLRYAAMDETLEARKHGQDKQGEGQEG